MGTCPWMPLTSEEVVQLVAGGKSDLWWKCQSIVNGQDLLKRIGKTSFLTQTRGRCIPNDPQEREMEYSSPTFSGVPEEISPFQLSFSGHVRGL